MSYKIINNIKNNISLQLKDKSEYSAVVGKTDGLEPENNEGRGLIRGTPFALEFQTALPVVGQDDNEVLKNIKSEVSILCENNKDGAAFIGLSSKRITSSYSVPKNFCAWK